MGRGYAAAKARRQAAAAAAAGQGAVAEPAVTAQPAPAPLPDEQNPLLGEASYKRSIREAKADENSFDRLADTISTFYTRGNLATAADCKIKSN